MLCTSNPLLYLCYPRQKHNCIISSLSLTLKWHHIKHYSRDSASDTFQVDKLSKYSYWRERYKKNDSVFEWFLNSKEASEPILRQIESISTTSPSLWCLDLGCGLSQLTTEILQRCPRPLCAMQVDFVQEALSHQARQWAEVEGHSEGSLRSAQCLVCADVKHLPLRSGAFNLVLDKGTMDALLKARLDGAAQSKQMICEALRLLAPGGRYIQISDEDPDSRQLFLDDLTRHMTGHVVSSAENVREEQVNIECDSTKDNLESIPVRKDLVAPWRFEIIHSQSGAEYFLYWTEKL